MLLQVSGVLETQTEFHPSNKPRGSSEEQHMGQVVVQSERVIAARSQHVRAFLADYRDNRPRILPPEYFEDYRIEQGGLGAGTVFSYRLQAGGRESVPDARRGVGRRRAARRARHRVVFGYHLDARSRGEWGAHARKPGE